MLNNMSGETLMLFLVIMLALVVVLIIFLRWFSYRERMARIAQEKVRGFYEDPEQQGRKQLSNALTVTLIGVAITIGLLTMGIGPWLLGGLIPIFVGLSMVLTYVISAADKEKDNKALTNEVAPAKEVKGTETTVKENRDNDNK